jgi:hypothetical protein
MRLDAQTGIIKYKMCGLKAQRQVLQRGENKQRTGSPTRVLSILWGGLLARPNQKIAFDVYLCLPTY